MGKSGRELWARLWLLPSRYLYGGIGNPQMKGESVKMKLRSKMVNDIPIATVYTGMSVERLEKLNQIRRDAATEVFKELGDDHDYVSNDAWDRMVDARFRSKCERAASKAAWHSNKKKVAK